MGRYLATLGLLSRLEEASDVETFASIAPNPAPVLLSVVGTAPPPAPVLSSVASTAPPPAPILSSIMSVTYTPCA